MEKTCLTLASFLKTHNWNKRPRLWIVFQLLKFQHFLSCTHKTNNFTKKVKNKHKKDNEKCTLHQCDQEVENDRIN